MSNLSSFGPMMKPLMDHAQKFAAKQKGSGKKKVTAQMKVKAKVGFKAK